MVTQWKKRQKKGAMEVQETNSTLIQEVPQNVNGAMPSVFMQALRDL